MISTELTTTRKKKFKEKWSVVMSNKRNCQSKVVFLFDAVFFFSVDYLIFEMPQKRRRLQWFCVVITIKLSWHSIKRFFLFLVDQFEFWWTLKKTQNVVARTRTCARSSNFSNQYMIKYRLTNGDLQIDWKSRFEMWFFSIFFVLFRIIYDILAALLFDRQKLTNCASSQ